MIVCTHSFGLPCPYCGADEPHGAPCAVIARNGLHQLLHVGGARRTLGTDRKVIDRVLARRGITVDWDNPKPIEDGRTSWPIKETPNVVA